MVEQKENCVRIMVEWIQHLEEDETCFNNIIIYDETWLYQDPEIKQQSSQWVKKGTGPPKKTHAQKARL